MPDNSINNPGPTKPTRSHGVGVVTDYEELKPLALFLDQLQARQCQPHTNELPEGCTLVTDYEDMRPLALFLDEKQRRQTQPHDEID